MTDPSLIGAEKPLPPLPAGWRLVNSAVLRDGSLVLLAADVDIANEQRRGTGGLPHGNAGAAAAGANAQLWCYDDNGFVAGPSFPLEDPFWAIDRFNDGRWLLVGRRSIGEPNARVLSPGGQLLTQLVLGDGIQQVGVDQHDQIWVGWFDEGVLGNEGWRVPELEWPPLSLGLGAFSADGRFIGLSSLPDQVDSVDDCCALNVVEEGAWACTYPNFPLLQLRIGHEVRWWSNELAGPKAIAVSGGHALVAGGYRADANRLALVSLGGEGNGELAQPIGSWRLPLMPRTADHPNVVANFPWQHPTLLAGRGDTIHLVYQGIWHRWRVLDAVAAVYSGN